MVDSRSGIHTTGISAVKSVTRLLVINSFSKSTRIGYQRSWEHFISTCRLHNQSPIPASVSTLLVYISHCSTIRLAYSTVMTRISAIACFHKLRSLVDNTQHFVVKKALLGYKNMHGTLDSRKPISLDLLHAMCSALNSIFPSQYDIILFRAMFLLAFYGFLRVGEFTCTSRINPHLLQDTSIIFQRRKGKVTAFTIQFNSYKHSKDRRFALNVMSKPVDFCPVRALHTYLLRRPKMPGPLFVFANQRTVSAQYFHAIFKSCIASVRGTAHGFSPHSFRIGAASHCMQQGFTSEQIARMGRWRSRAVEKYLRIPSFNV